MTNEVSPSEAARRLGATTRSVQRWIATGRLPARRVGGRWRVATDVIDAFAATDGPAPVPRSPASASIRRVFVANRGEIARRITATCDRVGIVAVVPDAASIDLLDVAAVVAAARTAGADAVHPGFGFLAENAGFAQAVIDAGLRWVGPPPSAIAAMGDKAAARQLAASLGIPVVDGYDGEAQDDETLGTEAARIGAPLIVKPAAGGGGKGMRVVRDLGDLPGALAGARREAIAAFGDERLVLERLVEAARHIEVQVLYDGFATGVHLGERDCSIQRRHQKILEETPGPTVGGGLRAQIAEAALRLASAVGYRSAGTVEFVVDERDQFFFLEMNTRLQVEHPVTELVTGIDLVAEQLRIAAGEPLGFDQAAVDARQAGHAIEVRLYAEDAEQGFLPATGRVALARWPEGSTTFGPVGPAGIRVDSGIESGDVVDERFDPMLAKIVAAGVDREEALARLTAALDETVVLGLVTNLRFLRWLVREDAVRSGRARTDVLDRIWPPDGWDAVAAIPAQAWDAASNALLETLTDGADPWSGGWRLNARPRLRITGDDGRETIERLVVLDQPSSAPPPIAVVDGSTVHVDVAGRSVGFRIADPPDADEAARAAETHGSTAHSTDVAAPMPGTVRAVHVGAGHVVAAGAPIVTLEAMKMEHVVAAPRAGRLATVAVEIGDQVARGTVVAVLEA
ncbi:MAG: biotin carboxylase N-terminal domain-containing protein [Chloroflexota bacterium]